MGSRSSKSHKLPSRQRGQASPFYWACQSGDMPTVQKMLPNLTYEQVNQIEPNGSTALHAASFYNHPCVVQLLLASGCSRTTVNSHGATAFQEAASDEIRTLFERPTSNRFIDENTTSSFKLVSNNGDSIKVENGVPDDWVKGHTSAYEAHEAQFMVAMANSVSPLKQIVKNRAEAESTKTLNALVSTAVPPKHPEHKTLSNLHKKFMSKMGIGNLLTMYTLETPLYKSLQSEADAFTVLLYFHLNELQDRAFQGRTYRGAKMTQNDINAYRWAIERRGYVLETRILQSTSLKKSAAQGFSKLEQNEMYSGRYSVLLTLDFPQKCPTAINLTKISETLPALSAYESEEEVLVLPFTLFTVREIKIDNESGQYRITLTNIPTPELSLSDAIKHVNENN